MPQKLVLKSLDVQHSSSAISAREKLRWVEQHSALDGGQMREFSRPLLPLELLSKKTARPPMRLILH